MSEMFCQFAPDFTIRPFTSADSIVELTSLLHAAYRPLGARGLNYTAVDQSTEITARRIESGECLVAVDGRRLLGTIVFYPAERASGCPWYDRPEVSSLGQFGVLPSLQRSGIGRRLLATAEDRAAVAGATEIALDTAEPAAQLIDWYGRCGYRLVEHAQWAGKIYRSVIMSKTVVPRGATAVATRGSSTSQPEQALGSHTAKPGATTSNEVQNLTIAASNAVDIDNLLFVPRPPVMNPRL